MPGRLALAVVATLALAGAVAPASGASPRAPATPDAPATTPVAAAGTPAARTSSLSKRGLRRKLRAGLRAAGGNGGAWVFDTGAARKQVLFGRGAKARRILASNQKLFTTAAALDRFGSTHRFETAAYARGKRIGKRDQVIDGDLVIRGDGDPALGTQTFAGRNGLPVTRIGPLAQAVKGAGIRGIRGKVRADDTIFDRRRGIPATGYSAGPYLSPLSGLSYNSGYGSGGYARAPELKAAKALRKALRKKGIRVGPGVGRASLSRRALRREPLATVTSPTLATLAAATNKPSNNFYAEMLLKRIGGGLNNKGTTKRGARRVQRFARRSGTRVSASDGSGLGRGNKASPKQVGKLLRRMNRSREGLAFRQSLAVAGRDGTLAGRMRGTAAQGDCRGKTGTLSGVSALSGYCRVGNHRVVFSILMNGVDVNRARSAQDRMAAAIARYRR